MGFFYSEFLWLKKSLPYLEVSENEARDHYLTDTFSFGFLKPMGFKRPHLSKINIQNMHAF